MPNIYGVSDGTLALVEATGDKIGGPPSAWLWVDTSAKVVADAGMHLITDPMWNGTTDAVRAAHRPVIQPNGLRGVAIVKENIFFVRVLPD